MRINILIYGSAHTDTSRRGAVGYIEQVEIDTLHFIGNFPESCEIHALSSEEVRFGNHLVLAFKTLLKLIFI